MKVILPTRRLIPKWRQVRRTLATQEAASALRPLSSRESRVPATDSATVPLGSSRDLEEFETAVALWEEFKEPGVLGDILSFSLQAPLQQRIIDLGNRAIQSGAPVTPAQRFVIRQLAHSNGDGQDPMPSQSGEHQSNMVQPLAQPIRRLRELLRTDPENSLALLDFAQLQAAIGRNDVADKSLRTALSMAPNNRLVLRTLARFYVHTGEDDRAHQLLRRHERTAVDPWLMASEIALADLAGKPSAFLSKGRRMLLGSGKTPSPNFTELAGSIAMIELGSGNLKKAREFQRIALVDPTDNVAAQAVDREREFGIALNAPKVERAIAASAEAQMLQSWLGLMPDAVEGHALMWHNEEPFSSRPVQMLTALFAYRGDTKMALNWLKVGLRSDGEDRGLLINLAYVQARAGLLDQARLTMLKARRLWGHEVEPYLLATEGLVAYNRGRFEEGDQLYGQAIRLFDAPDKERHNISTYCLLNQAIVALEHRHPRAAEIVARTNEAMQKRPSPDAVMLLKVVTTAGGASTPPVEPQAQQEQPRQRLTSQWIFDPKSNSLTERKGLTAPGAKAILLLEDSSK